MKEDDRQTAEVSVSHQELKKVCWFVLAHMWLTDGTKNAERLFTEWKEDYTALRNDETTAKEVEDSGLMTWSFHPIMHPALA